MKPGVFFVFIFCFIIGSPVQAQDTLYWSAKRKLSWKDFKGSPDSLSGHNAMTTAGIGYGIRYGEKSFSYTVDCYFLCKSSWTMTDSVTVLAHEQGHFDISELFARKMRKAFSAYVYNFATVSGDLRKIQLEMIRLREEMNNLYDKETDYSRDKKQQQHWSNKIRAELDKLKDCASR